MPAKSTLARQRVASCTKVAVFGLCLAAAAAHAAPVAETESNNTPGTADALTAGGFGTGAIDSISDVDFWKVAGINTFDLIFAYVETSGASSTDSVLDVIANDGTTLIESDNDDGSGTSSAVAGAVAPQSGNVLFKVSENGNDATITSYSLFQAIIPPDQTAEEVEPNDTAATASIITAPVMTGTVSAGDTDVYSFLVSGSPVKVVVIVDEDPDNDNILTDTRVSILDSDGTTVLATGDDDPAHNANAVGAIDSPHIGTFFLRITNGGGAADNDYRFVVLVNGAATFQNACCLSDGTCQDLLTSTCASVSGTIQGPGSRCATASCAQPTGACCLADCSCTTLSQADCLGAGGRWHGAGSSCATDNCGVTIFRDHATFEAGTGALVIEDFEELPARLASGCGTPIPGGSSCFSAAQIAPGLSFEEPGPLPGISGIGAGFFAFPIATTSDMICGGDTPDSFDVVLTNPGVHAVGMKVLAITSRHITVAILGEGGVTLGHTELFTDPSGTYLGITSDAPLTRLVMTATTGQNAICVDDVQIRTLPDANNDGVPDRFACVTGGSAPVLVSPPAALNTNAITDSGNDAFPAIASDGHGNWVAVWSSQSLGGNFGTDFDILVSRSIDNGATWTPPAALNTNATTDTRNDFFPEIATDGHGNWVVVWQLGDISGDDNDILVARSTDNGATWTNPDSINFTIGSNGKEDLEPRLATDGLGHWLTVWFSSDNLGGSGGDDDILVSRSTDNGATWTAPAHLNNNANTDTGRDTAPRVTTDGQGHWVAVWDSIENLGGTNGTEGDILVARSTDNGATWTDPAPLSGIL